MTVLNIIAKYLKENGYDGLCENDECGCVLNGIGLCGGDFLNCVAAYRYKYDKNVANKNCDDCNFYCDSESDEIMLPEIKTDCPALKRAPL